MAANQVGKTQCGSAEDTYHLTGLYPAWWKGRVFRHPVLAWVCGQTNDKVRDTMQKKLLGDPIDADQWGAGWIPKDCLSEEENRRVRKSGVPNAWQAVSVKHYTDGVFDGWSTCVFKAYEAGYRVFTSEQVHVIHLDEEPPPEIMTQCIVRQVGVEDGILSMTFTPEDGVTMTVDQFTNHLKPGQSLTNATWDDALHLTKEKREQILAALPEHERQMRSMGIPMMGDSLVFPVLDEEIQCDQFNIPFYYRFINGLDIGGWNHYTACTFMALNPDTDVLYVYDTYKAQGKIPLIHAEAIKSRGKDILTIYPHDANKDDRNSGESVAQQYRDFGVNMNYQCFSNPPAQGQEEGQGGISVDVGLMALLSRMETGRFKVFKNCIEWFQEKRMYHRKDGKVVRVNEDLMSATRYGAQSLRFADIRRDRDSQMVAIQSEIEFNPYSY